MKAIFFTEGKNSDYFSPRAQIYDEVNESFFRSHIRVRQYISLFFIYNDIAHAKCDC